MATEYLVKGRNGQITLTKTRVIISRKGFWGFASQGVGLGNKEIPIKSVTAVHFKPAGWILVGFIQFTIPGEHGAQGGVFHKATNDENTVTFPKSKLKYFQIIKDYINSIIDEEPLDFETLGLPVKKGVNVGTAQQPVGQPQSASQEQDQTQNFQSTQPQPTQDVYNTVIPKWYDKTWLVIILCILFFPVGLYAVWKNHNLSKLWKIVITAIIITIVIASRSK